MKKFLLVILLTGILLAGVLFFYAKPFCLKKDWPQNLDIQLPFKMPMLNFGIKEEIKPPPFAFGEKFQFAYMIGPIKGGSASLTFVGEKAVSQQPAYLVIFESKVGLFYDKETIYANKQTFYPIQIERFIQNAALRTEITEKYDQENKKVEITKKGLFGTEVTPIKKDDQIQNAILLIYFCRQLPQEQLKLGSEFKVVLPVDEFMVRLTKIEKITVPAGEFEAHVFESSPEKIKLWISNDKDRIPLKMQNLTALGPSSIILERKLTQENASQEKA